MSDDDGEESSRRTPALLPGLPSSNLVSILTIYDARPSVRCRTGSAARPVAAGGPARPHPYPYPGRIGCPSERVKAS